MASELPQKYVISAYQGFNSIEEITNFQRNYCHRCQRREVCEIKKIVENEAERGENPEFFSKAGLTKLIPIWKEWDRREWKGDIIHCSNHTDTQLELPLFQRINLNSIV